MKDAKCVDTNEKPIFRFLRYYHFRTQNCQFSMNFHHNSKNEIRKNLKHDFSDFSFSSYGEKLSKFTSLQPPLNALTGLGTQIAQHQLVERK